MNSLEDLVTSAQSDFGAAQDAAALENAKAKYLGKTGQVTELMKGLGKLDPEQRKAQGALINAAKEKIEQALTARREDLANAQLMARLGYSRYGAQGGDWGGIIVRQLGLVDPTHLIGLDWKSTRLNSSHSDRSRMPSSA